ncbi:ackA [Scenedesmus sp. PABB004]|nr:ackA [Scenedesmus sp. PABB004]
MGPLGAAGRILVLNAGSSSLKFKLFSLAPFAAGVGGMVDRIGDAARSCLTAKAPPGAGGAPGTKWGEAAPIRDHVEAMEAIMAFLTAHVSPSIAREVAAVGHRVVHGLDIHAAALLTDEVVAKVKLAATLAPLHNPPGLQGIAAAQKVFRGVPQVGVFDTAFHQTMPPAAYMYGVPWEWYEQHKIRRYGFHGTSHKYLAATAAGMLGRPLEQLNAITCHLGNGSSVTAVKGGLSVDTSMGLTPLEGLVMGTRCGDLDPAIPLHMMATTGASAADMAATLNKRAGLAGLCGDNDLRAIIDRQAGGDARAGLALDVFVYRVRKYIGSYAAALGGRLDALVFSAGIGENSALIRRLITDDLQGLGIEVDPAANEATVGGAQGDISGPGARTRVLVVPTDEELSIAQQTLEVLSAARAGAGAAPAAA